ncbi:MAG TPA: hypothetical protein PK904_19580, partial [Bacteroidales bacterium]|nr:hypothetical protein [Bacteroidales bacterium]
MLALGIGLMLFTGNVWGQSAVVTLRPTHIDLSSTTSEGAVLMTLSSYSSNDARYRLYNGSNQYNPWDEATDTYISSTSYANGPQVPGTPTTSTTFWILFQRGNNINTAASYRDRLGPAYSSNYITVSLPAATSISTSFNLTGTFTGAGGYDNTIKHVVLGFNGITLVTATSTTLTNGAFTLVCPTGTTIDKIEVRAIDNTSIANITGSWTTTTDVGDIPSGGSPTPLITLSTSSLSGFTYLFGSGPSAEQSFTVSGTNLTTGITVTPPTNYEISTGTGGSFTATNPITLTQTGGTVAETTIYVRLKAGLAVGTYNNEDITATSTDADNQTVTCSGSVSDPNVNVEDFANFPETGTAYNTGTFLGQDGSTWNYVKCAGANSGYIDAPTPYLGKDQTPSSEIYSGTISGGIGTLSFEYMQVFSTNVDLNILVNNNLVGNVTSSSQQSLVLNSGDIIVNVAGDFVIKFSQNAGGGQVSIDNVTWTPYSTGGNLPPSITNIVRNPASGITSSTTVSVSADVTDSDGTVEDVELQWGTSAGTYPNPINMSLSSKGTYVTDSDIPEQADGTTVYYVIYALDDDSDDATSSEQSYTVTDEPTNHPTDFNAESSSSSAILVIWEDAVPAADGYLIKGSATSYAAIVDPVDGTPESDALLVQNIAAGVQSHTFTGLQASTPYYFKIFAYNGTGASINYKTDGTVPQDDATTSDLPNIVINEVDADTPGTDAAEFIELYDGGDGNTSLDGLVVVFYNGGTSDVSYAAYDLDGYSTDVNGYFVLGNTGVTGVSLVFTSNTLQNGADAVALYQGDASSFPNETAVTTANLLDAFVYDTDDADDAELLVLLNSGQPQVDENGRGNSANHSNQRIPNGTGGQRNTDTYDQTFPTPNAENGYPIFTWTGTTDTDWNTASNWSSSIVPDATTQVVIPNVPNKPVINNAVNINVLNLGGGGELEVGATLTIESDMEMAVGSACKILPAGKGKVKGDLTIYADSFFDIFPLGEFEVIGTLTNSNSDSDNLIIHSDATGTGSLIHSTVGVNATVERYFVG